MTHPITTPMPNPNGPKAIARAQDSHSFIDGRCMDCDCRPWGRVAEWFCGANIPMITRTLP